MTQQEALDILKLGHNVFLTGAAGSGKTHLLNKYIAFLREHKISVGITASTGIAATHMGGTTIHSFTGMGISDALQAKDIQDLKKRGYLSQRFRKTRVLIIDEISMLDGKRLDLINSVCKSFKNVDLPFGGMQVILSGDFFQLPPINKNFRSGTMNAQQIEDSKNGATKLFEDSDANNIKNSQISTPDYAYLSKIWEEMGIKVCYLEEQFRQDDRSYLRVLNDIRNNEVSEVTVEHLTDRLGKDTTGYVRPTRLFSHNTDVDATNQKYLDALPGASYDYFMNRRGNPLLAESLKKSCLAPEKLVLKKGAQVMFVKNNFEEGYVNGTLGEVIGFTKSDEVYQLDLPIVRTFDGNELVVSYASWVVKEDDVEKSAISQIPLRLAWAITVHKSQGMTLDAAEVDLSRSFVPGMGYVALSRVRSLQGLKLLGLNQMALQIDPEIGEKDRVFLQESDENVLTLEKMEKEEKQKMQKDFLEFLREK